MPASPRTPHLVRRALVSGLIRFSRGKGSVRVGLGSTDVLVASVCVLGMGLGSHVNGEKFLPGYPSRGGWEGRSASVCIWACLCVYELSLVVVCVSMSIVLFFSFLKIQLKWHLLPSTLAESVAPSLPQSVHFLMRASMPPVGRQVCTCPSPFRFWS